MIAYPASMVVITQRSLLQQLLRITVDLIKVTRACRAYAEGPRW